MGVRRKTVTLVMIGALATLLMGCTGPAVREGESLVPPQTSPGIIAVVPFFARRSNDASQKLVRYPGFEGYIPVGEILRQGPETVTSLFRQRLTSDGYHLVSQEMVARALPLARSSEGRPEVLAQRVAIEVKGDSVLMGWVFRYTERIGNAWGARQPASVAFVVLLFNGRKGKLSWRGKFDETQKPLSEDALDFFSFVRRGGRWLTARQLAADGVNLVLLTFPGQENARVNR